MVVANSGNGFAVTCPNYALHAAQHRTQIGADTTTAPKMGAKLKAQGAQELRSDRSLTTQACARAHEHTPLRDDVNGVRLELGGRWPARKSSLELEERGPQSCTCHLGRGGDSR